MPNLRWLLALITHIHRFAYRASGGRIGSRLGGSRMLLLEHVGRRTGRTRSTPLLYVEDGARLVVAASNAGDDRHPAWWLNLQHAPEAAVQVGRERFAVCARAAGPDDRVRLWPLLEASYPAYADYRERTRREIPVVILERSARAPRGCSAAPGNGHEAGAGIGPPPRRGHHSTSARSSPARAPRLP